MCVCVCMCVRHLCDAVVVATTKKWSDGCREAKHQCERNIFTVKMHTCSIFGTLAERYESKKRRLNVD